MKRNILILTVVAGLAVLFAASVWAVDPMPMKKGEAVTVTGNLSCSYCKMAAGVGHKCSPDCCAGCIKAGDAPVLQDQKDNLYLLINKEMGKPLLTPERLALIGHEVTVKGLLSKAGGLQAVYVESMEKAPEKPAAAEKAKPAEKPAEKNAEKPAQPK